MPFSPHELHDDSCCCCCCCFCLVFSTFLSKVLERFLQTTGTLRVEESEIVKKDEKGPFCGIMSMLLFVWGTINFFVKGIRKVHTNGLDDLVFVVFTFLC